MDKKEKKLNYTTILHSVRKELGLSLNEYCIADSIYHLSNNPSGTIVGWCYASKAQLGDNIGITEQAVYPILKKLISLGLVEKNPQTKYLRTTSKWYNMVVLGHSRNFSHTQETLARHSRNFSPDTKETLVNNNIDNNINNNNTIATSNEVATIVNYFFELKGWANQAKEFYQKKKIVYSRYTKPAKYLLELCDGNVEEAKDCLKKVADWANSRNLDWSIETVFKKWYELDFLKPKEKKPYVNGCRVFQRNNKWWLIEKNGEIKEYVGGKDKIVYQ